MLETKQQQSFTATRDKVVGPDFSTENTHSSSPVTVGGGGVLLQTRGLSLALSWTHISPLPTFLICSIS